MSVKQFDPKEIQLIICGVPINGGYADGTFIEMDQESNDFDDVVGVDGDVTRTPTHDPRATLTLTLMQSSDANAALSAINNLDKLAGNGAGVGPFMMKDNLGTSLYAGKCWIMKPPKVTYDKTAKERAWTIRVVLASRLDGGN